MEFKCKDCEQDHRFWIICEGFCEELGTSVLWKLEAQRSQETERADEHEGDLDL